MSFQDLFQGRTNSDGKVKQTSLSTRNRKQLLDNGVTLKQPSIGTKQKSSKGHALQTIPSGGTFTGDIINDGKAPLQECNGSLHKKVSSVSFASDVSMFDESVASHHSKSSATGSRSSIRSRKKKVKSVFSILMTETQQFQKVVSDLETFLILNPTSRDAVGECPEATWKARILLRSAQDADEDLRSKLEVYEKTLASLAHSAQQIDDDCSISPKELRLAQTSSQKLRRDFERSHKILFSCLTQYEKRQHAEVKQLRAVKWSASKKGNPASNDNNPSANTKTTGTDNAFEDFFDQAMRQRDLERLQTSMEQVSTIYEDLAGIVNMQQEQIDVLESDVEEAATKVNNGSKLFSQHRLNPFASCGEMIPTTGRRTDDDNKNNLQSYIMPSCGTLSTVIQDVDFISSGTKLQRFDSKITLSDPPKRTITSSKTKPKTKKENDRWLLESKYRGLNSDGKEPDYDAADDNDDDVVADDDLLEFIRISEGFHWMMPFENMREDFNSVRNDILSVGKGVVATARQAGKGLECTTPKSHD